MKKLLVLSFLVMCSMATLSQTLTSEEIEKLKPYHYQTKAMLNFIPINLDAGGQNLTAGYGVNLDGFIGKYASFSAGLTTSAYWDQNYDKGKDPDFSVSYQGISRASTSWLNVSFHVSDKIAMGKIKVEKFRGTTANSSGTYNVYDIYKKRGPVRKIFAVRGGIYNWTNGIVPNTDDNWLMLPKGSTIAVKATDKTFTTLHTSDFSVGASLAKFVAKSDMGGGGIVSYFRNFYVDFLINSSITVDNHVDKLNNSYAFQLDQGNMTKVTAGWRVGWKLVGLGRKYWTAGYLLEAGVRPGIEGRGGYFQIGILLGTKYPFVPMK